MMKRSDDESVDSKLAVEPGRRAVFMAAQCTAATCRFQRTCGQRLRGRIRERPILGTSPKSVRLAVCRRVTDNESLKSSRGGVFIPDLRKPDLTLPIGLLGS